MNKNQKSWETTESTIDLNSDAMRKFIHDMYELTHDEIAEQEQAKFSSAQAALTRMCPGS